MSEFTPNLLPFGGARPSDNEKLNPEIQEYALKIYREAWDAYKDADCPYGESDEAMLVWYSFRTSTTDETVAMGKN